MVHDTQPRAERPVGVSIDGTTEGSYIDWPAILAGGVFALAISFLLISFGASLGLSLTSPYSGEGVSAAWLAIAAGLWFAWVMVTGFGAGGYLAGRMRRRIGDATEEEAGLRDGGHGLLVWATGVLVSMVLAAAGVGGVLSAATSAVGTAAEATTDAVSSDYFANLMLRSEGQGDGESMPDIDPEAQTQIASIITRTATSGEMIERDRNYLAQLVAQNTDLDPSQARARVDEVNTEIDQARDEALAAVETARVTGVVFGFIATATLLIGALAAFFAAAAGGRHRDEGLGFDIFVARR